MYRSPIRESALDIKNNIRYNFKAAKEISYNVRSLYNGIEKTF